MKRNTTLLQSEVLQHEEHGHALGCPVAFVPLAGDDALASTSAAFCVASATSAAAEDWLCWALAAAFSAVPAAWQKGTLKAQTFPGALAKSASNHNRICQCRVQTLLPMLRLCAWLQVVWTLV